MVWRSRPSISDILPLATEKPDIFDIVYIGLLLVGGLYSYLRELGRPLGLWDESFYLSAARYSVEHDHWFVPQLPYEAFNPGVTVGPHPFILKPPLAIQTQMVSMELFGISPAAARLPAVGFTVLTALVVYALGRRLYNQSTGFVGAIIFLTTHYVYVGSHGGRTGTVDIQMVFFGTVAVGCLWIGVFERDHRRLLFSVAGIAGGLTILTKGFGAGIVGVIVLPLVFLHWRQLVTREGLLGAVLSIVVPLVWFVGVEFTTDGVLYAMFEEQVLLRTTGSLSTYPATFSFMKAPYFRQAPEFFDPWGYLLVCAIVAIPIGLYHRRQFGARARTSIFLLWWLLSVFAFFVITGNHIWYILPMAVPASLLCADCICEGLRPSPEAAGLFVGGTLSILQSLFAGTVIRRVFSGEVGVNPPVRFVGVLIFWCVLVGCWYHEQLIADSKQIMALEERTILLRIRRLIDSIVDRRVFLTGVVILLVLQTPLTGLYSTATVEQQDVGALANTTVPAGERIYLAKGQGGPIYTFVFFSGRSFQDAPLAEIESNQAIRYAVLRNSTVERLDRPHRTLGSMKAWRLRFQFVEFIEKSEE